MLIVNNNKQIARNSSVRLDSQNMAQLLFPLVHLILC